MIGKLQTYIHNFGANLNKICHFKTFFPLSQKTLIIEKFKKILKPTV